MWSRYTIKQMLAKTSHNLGMFKTQKHVEIPLINYWGTIKKMMSEMHVNVEVKGECNTEKKHKDIFNKLLRANYKNVGWNACKLWGKRWM